MEKYEVMTAREMFINLGYKKIEIDTFDNTIEYRCMNDDGGWKLIIFYLNEKEVSADENWEGMNMDIPTLKAIYKQCEELGWLE